MRQLVQQHWFPILLCALIGIQASSLFNGIMEVDAMLYATIAKHMAVTNDWVNLFGDGHDWLDKPHLPFWLEAVSFKIFGINDFAYKLPGFLSFLAGLFYCYRLAKDMYGVAIAQTAVLILAGSLHLFLAVFDLRAEAFLTTFVIAATWHIYRSLSAKFSLHIVWAALYCAAACMTKGVFVLVSVGGGFVIYWLYSRQWKQLFHWKWWVLLLLTVLFITPELYCLYVQFDLHPEKLVLGSTNRSGIRFFFWDSQFGRFFNNGPIKGSGDPFFFVHTFLWAFLPWSLTAYAAVFMGFKQLRQLGSQWLIVGGTAISTFLLFSLSKFQLPHYIVIVFPHFSIVTAVYLQGLQKDGRTICRWNRVMLFLLFVAATMVVLLSVLTRFIPLVGPLLLLSGTVLLVTGLFKQNSLLHLLGKSVCFALLLYGYMNVCFYPALLNYQGGKNAAAWVNKQYPATNAIMYQCNIYSFQWYAKAKVWPVETVVATPANMLQPSMLVLTTKDKLDPLRQEVAAMQEVRRFSNFHVSGLTLQFLNQPTRQQTLDTLILLKCRLKE